VNHESAIKTFPTNGWAFACIGHPDHGQGMGQPGGWIYNILPYIEQEPIYKCQSGLTGTSLQAAAATLMQTPINLLYCPSRRAAALYPNLAVKTDEPNDEAQTKVVIPWLGGDGQTAILYDTSSSTRVLANDAPLTCRNDYAGNGYNYVDTQKESFSCPPLGTAFGLVIASGPKAADVILNDAEKMSVIRDAIGATDGGKGGIFFPLSMIASADIRDGLSNTYLIGEKYMNPDNYTNGKEHGDQWCAFIGDDPDITRYCIGPYSTAAQDSSDRMSTSIFGSAHAGSFNMAFCDGSVHPISYGISPEIHGRLSHRSDGTTVDLSLVSP
jgi:prepilin-type processing-associated H-X9-DG protein